MGGPAWYADMGCYGKEEDESPIWAQERAGGASSQCWAGVYNSSAALMKVLLYQAEISAPDSVAACSTNKLLPQKNACQRFVLWDF